MYAQWQKDAPSLKETSVTSNDYLIFNAHQWLVSDGPIDSSLYSVEYWHTVMNLGENLHPLMRLNIFVYQCLPRASIFIGPLSTVVTATVFTVYAEFSVCILPVHSTLKLFEIKLKTSEYRRNAVHRIQKFNVCY